MDQHTLQIVPDVQRVNAQRRDALLLHPPVPGLIALRIAAQLMGETINLDGEQSPMTVEVQNVWAERMLTLEFEAIRLSAKQIPKSRLWWAQRSS